MLAQDDMALKVSLALLSKTQRDVLLYQGLYTPTKRLPELRLLLECAYYTALP
jgi:hypothetical protein